MAAREGLVGKVACELRPKAVKRELYEGREAPAEGTGWEPVWPREGGGGEAWPEQRQDIIRQDCGGLQPFQDFGFSLD